MQLYIIEILLVYIWMTTKKGKMCFKKKNNV